MEGKTFRGFVAIGVPDEIKSFIRAFTGEAAKHLPNCRFVDVKSLHLTLQFLGNSVSESLVPDISQVIYETVRATAPFKISLGDAGTFPEKGRPRVFYVGLSKGRQETTNLALNLQSRLGELGFKEDASFEPHLTLARLKDRRGPRTGGKVDLQKYWQDMYADFKTKHLSESGSDLALSWTADKVALIKSELSSKGPVYSVVSEHFLGQ